MTNYIKREMIRENIRETKTIVKFLIEGVKYWSGFIKAMIISVMGL